MAIVPSPDKNSESKIKPILIEEELKHAFLDYAMSVVVSRAIPDIRDGLKPVHRRVLYSMYQAGYFHNRPYHKSVRVVGDVLGKYHPHGDQAVYNTMVGMVQDFVKRYPLLDGQGNWGSVDGDNAAAMRYTEIKMAKIASELLHDLDKETVKFVPNFDESTVEPVILPSRLPNLLINGTTGIAVGMATAIPPHNLSEVIDACLSVLEKPSLSDEELFEKIPAPDFPTGGIICGRGGIVKAYKTGRGNLILRGVVEIEENKKGSSIIITELPYMVNKAALAIQVADLVRDKVIEGISNIRDESDKKGMRLVIEIKRGEVPQVVLNQLYKFTPLQTSVSILMLGLLDNRPLVFTLRQLLDQFLFHRREIIFKRTHYDLRKAKEREHLIEGFLIALKNIDEVVAAIKASQSAEQAIEKLNQKFSLSAEQGKAILEMRLQRLTGLEQEKIKQEMEEIKKAIAQFKMILENEPVLRQEIVKELVEIKNEYGDARKTRIEGAIDLLTEADLIPDEEVVVTLTRKGYIKRVPLTTYGLQHRGGKGKMGMADLGESDDIMQDVFVAKNHDYLLFFTSLGRVYSLQVYKIPEASRTAKGRAIVNLLPLTPGERVVKLLCTRDLIEGTYIVMLTRQGTIKRTDASEFANIRSTGIRAVTLHENDELVSCALSSGNEEIIIATARGQGIHFKETEVRSMGRQAAGVIGIRLKADDYVVGMEVVTNHGDILVATTNGYGKRVTISDFRVAHRGGVGVRMIPTDKRNGKVIGLTYVTDTSNILLIDQTGKIIRLSSAEVRTMGRQAKGVRLIRLDEGQQLASIVAFEEDENNNEGSAGSAGGTTIQTPPPSMPKTMAANPFDEQEQQSLAPTDADTDSAQEDTDETAESLEQQSILYADDSDKNDPFMSF